MKVLEKYEGIKTYMFPNGVLATPEVVLEQFPAITTFAHVIETDMTGEVMFAVMNLSALRSQYEIDPNLNEAEAIAAIETIMNAPPPEPEPAEDPLADALLVLSESIGKQSEAFATIEELSEAFNILLGVEIYE